MASTAVKARRRPRKPPQVVVPVSAHRGIRRGHPINDTVLQGLVLVGDPEVTVLAKSFSPAVLHQPGAVLRGLGLLEFILGIIVVPPHGQHLMVRAVAAVAVVEGDAAARVILRGIAIGNGDGPVLPDQRLPDRVIRLFSVPSQIEDVPQVQPVGVVRGRLDRKAHV